MGYKLLLFLLVVCFSFSGERAFAYDLEIGLTHPRNGALFSSEGDIFLDTSDGKSYRFEGVHAVKIRVRGSWVKLGSGSYRLPVQLSGSAGWFRINGKSYRGMLIIRRFMGKLLFVNHLDIEDYLKGVVSKEMPPDWPLEALKAQAVIARTYAIYKRTHMSDYKGFDLYDSTLDQVYQGLDGEGEKGNRAVESTAGIVITYKGEVIKSYYHSTSGGRTEDPVNVWGKPYPYLRSVSCGFDRASPSYHWRYSVSLSRLERLLRKKGYGGKGLRAIKVKRYTVSGRNKTLELVYRRSPNQKISAIELRQIVGNTNLKSTHFYAIRNGKSFTFIGKGSGHGVGLCQWGARGMAEKGYHFRDIIRKYYHHIQIDVLAYGDTMKDEHLPHEAGDVLKEDRAETQEEDGLASFIETLEEPSLHSSEEEKRYQKPFSPEEENVQYKELYLR